MGTANLTGSASSIINVIKEVFMNILTVFSGSRFSSPKKLLRGLGLWGALVALLGAASLHAQEDGPAVAKQIEVSEARVRVPMPGKEVTVAYFTLHNRRDAAEHLDGVSSPIAGRAELHQHREEEGMMRMRKVERVALPAHSQLAFEPGGYHVMLFDLQRQPQTGEEVELVLSFADGSQLSVSAEVESVFDRPHHHHH